VPTGRAEYRHRSPCTPQMQQRRVPARSAPSLPQEPQQLHQQSHSQVQQPQLQLPQPQQPPQRARCSSLPSPACVRRQHSPLQRQLPKPVASPRRVMQVSRSPPTPPPPLIKSSPTPPSPAPRAASAEEPPNSAASPAFAQRVQEKLADLRAPSPQRTASPAAARDASSAEAEAKQLRESGSVAAALAIYSKLKEIRPLSAAVLSGLACCHSDQGNFDLALEVLDELLALERENSGVEHHMLKVEVLLARALYQPTSSNFGAEVARHLERVAASPAASDGPMRLRLLCAAASMASWREEHHKALSLACQALIVDASSPQPLLLISTIHLRLGEHRPALRSLAKAMTQLSMPAGKHLLPASRWRALAHATAAEACERLRQYQDAATQAEASLSMDSQLPLARLMKAKALHHSGCSGAALAELSSMLEQHPQHSQAQLLLGYLQLSSGDPMAVTTLNELSRLQGLSRSIAGAAKIYLALALSFHPCGSHHDLARGFALQGLRLHASLQSTWTEIEKRQRGPVEAARRLRRVTDLDLTCPQSRELAYLLAVATDDAKLSEAFLAERPPQPQRNSKRRSKAVEMLPEQPQKGDDGNPACPAEAEGAVKSPSLPLAQPTRSPRDEEVAEKLAQTMKESEGAELAMAEEEEKPEDASPCRMVLPPLQLGYDQVVDPNALEYGNLLGVGGSAKVYRGNLKGRQVAIKHVEDGIANLDSVRKELDALRKLQHPRLVAFIGAVIKLPDLILVTEFMAGGSLYDRLFVSGMPGIEAWHRLILAMQVTEGVVFLHDNSVVHRDLKSLNILLDAMGNAKICDFGLAQHLKGSHISRRPGGEAGTPRYMAPECFASAVGKLSEKVDIWALGCVLVEIFANVVPYPDCPTLADIIRRIIGCKQSPEVPAVIPASASITRCVAYLPMERPTACQVAADLWEAHGGHTSSS